MSDKMRDDAIREAARNHAGDEYFNADRAYLLVSPYSGRIFDSGFDRGWQAAQAEQAESVPVMGEPAAWGVTKRYEDNVWFISDSRFTAQDYAQMYAHRIGEKLDQVVIPLYRGPVTSITAAELDALRKDAERWRKANEGGRFCIAEWAAISKKWVDLLPSTAGERIDAAIAGEGEKE